MTQKKQHLPDITGQHTQDPERLKVDKTQVLRKGNRNKAPLLTMKLSELISAGKGRSVFSDRVPLGTPTTLQGRNSWPTQNVQFVQFLFCFSIYFLLFWHSIFFFSLIFSERGHEVDEAGMWGVSGQS